MTRHVNLFKWINILIIKPTGNVSSIIKEAADQSDRPLLFFYEQVNVADARKNQRRRTSNIILEYIIIGNY